MFSHMFQADYIENLWTTIGTAIIKLIVVFILFFIVKSVGRKMIAHAFKAYKGKKSANVGRAHTLEKLAASAFSYTLFFVVLVIIFSIIGLPIASLLAGAGIIGLAIGFGAQGLVSDVVTGFFILLERQIEVNEVVTIDGFSGVVEEVGLRTIQLRGFDGVLHFIPNRNVTSVSNQSRGNMRALVDITVKEDHDIDHLIKVLQAACDDVATKNPNIVDGPRVIGVQALSASDMTIRVIAQTKNGEQSAVERDLNKAIKEVLVTLDRERNV
ncbi:mechanosensitive ion channel family protein [Camelliibacillus cellulosilyticus]|uniref:Mechanosensitive ion channel family protein n=1 Tax=Camelliibacillus cellulosilyticus TaxID=2174486 RepID=A0ABV9GIW1_9BACL